MAVKSGLCVGWDDGYPAWSSLSAYQTMAGRWGRFQNQAGYNPKTYHDFYDQSKHAQNGDGKIRNYDGADIFAILNDANIMGGNHDLLLTFNVKPSDEDMYKVLYNEVLINGLLPDEHVALIGKAIRDHRDAGRGLVKVRYLHEFTGQYPWGKFPDDYTINPAVRDGWNWSGGQFKKLWKRWTIILEGGSVSAINTKLAANSNQGGPALGVDATRLSSHGYDISGGLVVNQRGTDFSNVWCGNSDPKTPTSGNTNDYNDYWPGPSWVDIVACDVYPVANDTKMNEKMNNLTSILWFCHGGGAWANKNFGIPEFSRNPGNSYYHGSIGTCIAAKDDGTDMSDKLGRIYQWAEDHALVAWMCNYELMREPQCLDYLIMEPDNNGNPAYPNHRTVVRNRGAKSVYNHA